MPSFLLILVFSDMRDGTIIGGIHILPNRKLFEKRMQKRGRSIRKKRKSQLLRKNESGGDHSFWWGKTIWNFLIVEWVLLYYPSDECPNLHAEEASFYAAMYSKRKIFSFIFSFSPSRKIFWNIGRKIISNWTCPKLSYSYSRLRCFSATSCCAKLSLCRYAK